MPASTAPLAMRFDAAGLTLGAEPLLAGCHAGVVMSDGTRHTTTDRSHLAEAEGTGHRVKLPGDDFRPELHWVVAADEETGGLRLWLEVRNTMPHPITIERLDVLVSPTGYRAAPMDDLKLAQTGWQSWSYATPPAPIAQQARTATPAVVAPMLPPSEAERFLSSFMTILRDPEGKSLLAGFVSGISQESMIAVQPALDGHRLTASTYLEGMRLAPGEGVRSETLLLLFDRPDPEALETYARTVAKEMNARPQPRITTGWCSWYYFYTNVSEADMLRNLEVLAKERARMPVEVVQLDDGYQTAIGDWLSLNEKFPSGMRHLTDRIHAEGYQAGIWLAPFLVGENSAVYRKHPDWVLRDDQGEPINAQHNWGTRNFALDLTHPEVEEWLREVFRTICHDWNFDYLKIDFIYAGALRARRHDRNATGVQAYRRGLALIREIARDRFVLGCGCPFLPSIGYVDGARVGPDTAPFWSDPDPLGSAPALLNAIRSTLAHGWMHPHWFVNDPDCLIVRSTDTQLTEAEVQTWASVVALSGGMVLLSDEMSKLTPERAAIIPRALPPLGVAAVPRGDRTHLGVSECMQLAVDRPWGKFLVAGLFNWHEVSRSLTFFPEDWEMPGAGRYHLVDLWDGTHHGPLEGPFGLPETAPHGVRLLAVHPDRGRPQLVGSTLHLLGGAVEVRDEAWDGSELSLTLVCAGRHEGELVVYMPEGFRYVGDGAELTGRTLRVPVSLEGELRVGLRFEKG